MTPYYDHAGITIYHGDCREILPTLSLGVRRVAITDPPYNVGVTYGETTDDRRVDYEVWCSAWFSALRRSAAVVALTPGIVNVSMWCRIAEPNWIVAWLKPAAMGRSPLGFNNWEPVLLYGQTRNRGGVDVLTACIQPDAALEGHPCPKPLAWASGLLSRLAGRDDEIVDPFCGSGTTLLAAKQRGYRATGVEIEERYCEIAAMRLQQDVLPLLADPIPVQLTLLPDKDGSLGWKSLQLTA
jgi:site-specific DNA-methyltransferase (adenine-specific)